MSASLKAYNNKVFFNVKQKPSYASPMVTRNSPPYSFNYNPHAKR